MQSRLVVKNLPLNNELDRPAMSSIVGGFLASFLAGCSFVKQYDERVGASECNNGICVPYQDEEGNY